MRFDGIALGSLLALALAAGEGAAQTPPSAAEPELRARAMANLASYLTDRDYPHDAIQRWEQGIVGFRLDVDSEGKVAGCTIVQSSGSLALDSASCRIMTERARFTPARDSQGRAVPDSVHSRIRWVMPSDSAPRSRQATLFEQWADCASRESAKLAPTRLSVRTVTRKALAACVELEILTGQELGTEIALIPARNQIRAMTEAKLAELRKAPGARPLP